MGNHITSGQVFQFEDKSLCKKKKGYLWISKLPDGKTIEIPVDVNVSNGLLHTNEFYNSKNTFIKWYGKSHTEPLYRVIEFDKEQGGLFVFKNKEGNTVCVDPNYMDVIKYKINPIDPGNNFQRTVFVIIHKII